MSNIKNVAMITVCGRPNVGKSSLTNALVGEKVAIVSNKAQTTRNRIYGVVNREDTQYILLDTPGLHKPKSALGDYMVKVVTSSLSDVDCALLLVEPIPHVGGPEQALIDRIREEEIPCILCVNKIDTVEPAELLPVIAAYNQAWDGFDAIIPISAHTGSGLKDLMKELRKYAQEGPQLFPDGMTTDQPERQVMGEILREKLLLCLDKEIPHGTAVEITKFSERDSGVIDVDATIYCEKASHKGIIIGKQGAMLKKISSLARQDMEKFMGTKVYLETWVKVKENWRDNVNYVRSFGYRYSAGCRAGSENMRLVLSDTALPAGLPVREDWHYVDLSQLKIADCMGCFSCWVRTPGRCVIRDDAVGVYPLIAHSDHVIYVSRLFCGSYDVPMKTMLERAIPIQQAFIRIHHGETHHIQRAVAEKDAVILAYGDTGDEEQALFRLLAARNAHNMLFRSWSVRFLREEELAGAIREEVRAWESS